MDHNAKICDFGFARHAEDKQLLETFCGSLAYSAPEMINQKRYTGPGKCFFALHCLLECLDPDHCYYRNRYLVTWYHLVYFIGW